MNLGIQRRKIEDKVADCYSAVEWDAKAAAWVDSETFERFVFSFFELRRYYEQSDDLAVGLEILRLYTDAMRALQAASKNRELPLDRRESAERLIYELNYQVEAVMYEVDRNRQEANRDDGGAGKGDGGVPVVG